MTNRLRACEIMMSGVDPGQLSGLSSGHVLQSENLNIGSQINGQSSGSERRNLAKDNNGNAAAKANAECAGKGDAVTTPSRRGRPKGSKNKPKALLPGNRESPNTLKCLAFEIPSGEDMRRTLETFARGRQLGLFILSGNGMVRNVTLRNLAVPAGVMTYGGPFHIVSITGAFPRATENQEATGITVSLTDVQSGAIVTGSVMGRLLASGRVFVMAGAAAVIHQELPNVQPAQVQPRGLFESDLTEAQRHTNMMSEIQSLLGNDLSNLPPEHRNGQAVNGI